jgi:dye decolorizing peroxidase
VFAAFDLGPEADRESVARMMRLLSDDAARLTQGRAALADTEPELAATPARLTVTFGFGPGLFEAAGVAAARPPSVADLPAFPIDRLQDRWSGGDLLVQVCCDDAVTLAHAVRMLWKDTRAFAAPRWVQRGFLPARGSHAAGTTPRNLMGQVDGTVNPGSADLDRLVWAAGDPQWFVGGTVAVVRRIRMDLDTWDVLDREARELAVGRRLSDGAPLTGEAEHDDPDLAAVDAQGLPVIPDFAHIRRARGAATGPTMLRRGYSYDEGPGPDGTHDAGLVFVSYQADATAQFVPVQRRLAELDLLNRWTTPIGSAVFAIPPGCEPGGWVGQTLLG